MLIGPWHEQEGDAGMDMRVPLEVGVAVRDLDALIPFYTGTLGFAFVSVANVSAELSQQAGMAAGGYRVARLQTPYGERLKLIQPVDLPTDDPPTPYTMERRGAMYLTFIVADLDAMIARLLAAAVTLISGPEKVEVRPGVWLAFACDPEGNVLEFVQYADIAQYRPDLFPQPQGSPT